ncbi:MAG: glutamine--tRNA ligase/YqeY domain fusion protein [Polyangiaceae bacterium]|nr:glutamine--tRNA ligase/YqeY domain fusion protein [Polyangiaceae bacterium]
MNEPLRPAETAPSNFIHEIIEEEHAQGKHGGTVCTRFPPEPNGYLHIGHAKSICLNFGTALKYGGKCNLRFDDTNPVAEDVEFVDSIQADVRWLGFSWPAPTLFASDYFEQLFAWAVKLIEAGKAYVDSQPLEKIREQRGNFYTAGTESPFRNRPIAENLDLFRRMRAGEFPDGAHVLRAKIDMQSPNLNLRDPLMYRIRHVHHHRTGDAWCIYPMYDFQHGLSDAIEKVTHSVCTLEFEDHRPLYDWFIAELGLEPRPRQIEFGRLNLSYTIVSKRHLQRLVRDGHVDGWDDPRMPTLAGLRRGGYTPEAIRNFMERIGVSKRDGVVDVSLLEFELREDLNARAPRAMAVLDPIKVVIENYPEGESEEFEAVNHPDHPELGSRKLTFGREVYIDRDDFLEEAPKKWFRLSIGAEVRLRYACLIKCHAAVKDADGKVTELRCTWDPDSRGGAPKDGRKVKGTLHWVSAKSAIDAEVRLYSRLFSAENPMAGEGEDSFLKHLNPDSKVVLKGCKLEGSLAGLQPGKPVQFERVGYFCADIESREGAPVFNRTITLKDGFVKG